MFRITWPNRLWCGAHPNGHCIATMIACVRSVARLAAFLLIASGLQAYSVLTHEAIIDTAWDRDIKPLLLQRYPQSTPEDLLKAHASAYGGLHHPGHGLLPVRQQVLQRSGALRAHRRFRPEPDSRSAHAERTRLRAGRAGPLRRRYARPQRGGEPVGAPAVSEAGKEIRQSGDLCRRQNLAPQGGVQLRRVAGRPRQLCAAGVPRFHRLPGGEGSPGARLSRHLLAWI